ncbi:hypothetical protein HHI36_022080 [Cryptolaemus montrouzieri]|uniref:Uncharacterized protein n=1 Tax=Cryptolaemus montrouzieri TaxID=559131 RepID=A0ABD2MYQ7_9CUCU
MYKNILFLVGIALLNQVHAAYYGSCGLGPGQDVCGNKRCQPLVVRPQSVPKPPVPTISVPAPPLQVPLPSLPPVGGPCFCKKPIVKPAVIPKPVCAAPVYRRRISTSNNCASNQQNNEEVIETFGAFPVGNVGGCGEVFNVAGGVAGVGPISGVGPGLGVGAFPGALPYAGGPYGGYPYPSPLPETREQLKPADPVSVSIAYNLAKKAQNLKEDVLSFGFRQIPKEVPVQQKKANNIPEENLYSLNGAIVELKPVATLGKSLDEEAAEQLLDLQEEETVGEAGVRELSLGEVGYGLAKVAPTATYIDVPPTPFKPGPCKDPCYKPGSVIINQIPKLEPVLLPAPLPEPCAEKTCKYTDVGDFGSFGTYSSKRCSSCLSQADVYEQRVGCGCQ